MGGRGGVRVNQRTFLDDSVCRRSIVHASASVTKKGTLETRDFYLKKKPVRADNNYTRGDRANYDPHIVNDVRVQPARFRFLSRFFIRGKFTRRVPVVDNGLFYCTYRR